jgi:hypothetical protein
VILFTPLFADYFKITMQFIAINVPVAIAQKRGNEHAIMVSILADLTPKED